MIAPTSSRLAGNGSTLAWVHFYLRMDTSAYSALMGGHAEIALACRLAEELVVTPIVIGQLMTGFLRGRHRAENERGLHDFLATPRVRVVDVTSETAERYATVLDALRRGGKPIPTNDVWIAASAMEHGLVVLTTDAHFERVAQVVTRRFDP